MRGKSHTLLVKLLNIVITFLFFVIPLICSCFIISNLWVFLNPINFWQRLVGLILSIIGGIVIYLIIFIIEISLLS